MSDLPTQSHNYASDTFSLVVGFALAASGVVIILSSLSSPFIFAKTDQGHSFFQILGTAAGLIVILMGWFLKAIQPFRKHAEKIAAHKEDWQLLAQEVNLRVDLLEQVVSKFDALSHPPKDPLTIAATEIFVAKAQDMLTQRASYLIFSAGLCAVISGVVLAITALHLYSIDVPDYFTDGRKLDGTVAVIYLVKATTASALAIGVATMFGTLSFSFLHEAMVLYSRRHALRFGRLYVYMKDGKNIPFKDLQQAFRWNDEFSTGFKKMEIQTPIGKTHDTIAASVASISRGIGRFGRLGRTYRKTKG